MNVVLVMFKDKERREFTVPEDTTILGRRQDCHLRIPTKDVSRQHCAILLQNETVVAKDLGSANGTYVNDKRIAETELKPGDRLRVGPVTFVVQVDGRPDHVTPDDVAPTQPETETAGVPDDEETFELGEGDFDIDDPISALEEITEDDEDDMP